MQIAKIQKFFELTKNIFPSPLASLFNALYINILFRNPTNPFRIPFPFLRWPFSCRRWPSSIPLPIPPLFAHSPFHFSLFRPTYHLFPQPRTLRYNPFLPLIFLARFRFPVSVNLFRSLPVSCSPFPSIISIHCPFPVPRFRQSFPFIARFRFPVSVNLFHSLPVSGSPFPSIIFIHCPLSAFILILLCSPLIQLSFHSSNSLITHSSIVYFFFWLSQLVISAIALLSVVSNHLENCF